LIGNETNFSLGGSIVFCISQWAEEIVEAPEEQTHSFVITLWCEELDKDASRIVWRGRITHVASRECRYVKELSDIAAFIAPYLEAIGVRFGFGWRVRQWLVTKLLGGG
jgi:hypothetical protein